MSPEDRVLRLHSGTVALAIGIAACTLEPGGGSAQAAAQAPFLSHQALYELSLVKSRGSTSIDSARGRILYNF